MKVYTTFTPSHKVFYENYFLKSLPKDLDLRAFENAEQLCPTGVYFSKGWTKTCESKIDLFLRACEENMGDRFFYCDVDVQFFKESIVDILIQELGDYDIACQDEVTGYCSGVFVCQANEKTLKMFELIKQNYSKDDQITMNKYLHVCRHKKMSRRFFNFRHVKPNWNFEIPKNIVLHHANWTRGLHNKIVLLNHVKNKYEKLRSL